MQYVDTGAGLASHRVRLWQGGPASILTSSSGSSCTTEAPLVPSGVEGIRPRWRLMVGTAACCTQFFRCCPFSFPVQPQSTELPVTTEGRWRRRHLSPGHKAGLLTVLLMCTGCASQVTPGVEKGVTLYRATNPRTGGYHPELDARLGHPYSPFFLTSFMVSSCFSAHAFAPVFSHPSFLRVFAASSLSLRPRAASPSSMVCALFSLTPLYGVQLLPR